jgi:hypothetical protein
VYPAGSLTPIRSTSTKPRQPTVFALDEQVFLAVTRLPEPPPAETSVESDATVIHRHPRTSHQNACRYTSTFALLGHLPETLSHHPWTEAARGAVLEMRGSSMACLYTQEPAVMLPDSAIGVISPPEEGAK